jgi:flagellar motor protein MotB
VTTEPSLTSAAQLARRGHYTEAHSVLATLGGPTSDNPALLDLLARIHAQQGELAEADACWTRVLELDEASAAVQARRYRPAARRAAEVAAILLVVTGVGVTSALLARQDDPAPTTPDSALLAELRDTRQAQEDLARQLGGVQGELDTIRSRTKAIDDLHATLTAAGLLVTREGDVLTVAFPIGLFSTGTTLTAPGRQALTDLATHLRTPLTITVIGHTDNGRLTPRSRYADHIDLGLARARTATMELSTKAGLPLTSFAMTTTGETNPPFPNTTTDNRARNRTVTLRLSLP